MANQAEKCKTITEEKYQHFRGKYTKIRIQLKEAKAKAAKYLCQLSFASWVQDSAWANGLHLGFETFKAWLKDPAQKIDLDSVNIEDIPCTSETIWRLTSLGREEMPDAAKIDKFNYDPHAKHSDAAPEGA